MAISNQDRQNHLKVKAWNEYVVDYYALRLEKKTDVDYLRIEVFQGRFCVYKDIVYQSYSLTVAQMHERLRDFLKRYILAIKPFGIVYEDANFNPPVT